MSAIEARVVGIVSVAPTTEMSGQGRVLAQLVDVAGTNKAIIFSEEAAESSLADGTGVRLSPAGRSFAASIRKRAAEIAYGAVRTDCAILIACSGSPYDLTAAALAARYLSLPFLAYLFDDPVFQWPIGPLRTAAARLQRMWLPLAKTVIVPNEFLADEWRKRGAASISIVRNAATDLERCADGRGAALLAGGAGLTIAYTGSVYRAQADAFRNLLSALEVMHDQFHLHIFTSQAPSTVTGFGIRGQHVTRHDHVLPAEALAVLSTASILFLPLGFDTGIPEVIRTASPAKLGDYLRSGRPILAHVPADSFVAHFCRQHECALVVDQPDVGALESAVRFLTRGGPDVTRMVANAKAASEQFSADTARREFWLSLDRVIADDRRVIDKHASLVEAEIAEAVQAAGGAAVGAGEETELPVAPIVLFVGALAPLQGPDLLIEAFAQVSQTFPDLCLVLIGPDRGMRKQLAASASAFGIEERVHFRASIDNALRRTVYGRALIFVVPSRSEVMPVAALEAGAFGVPVLATDVCNFEKFAEASGCKIVSANSAALAEGLSQMLADRDALRRTGERLRDLVLERHQWLNGTQPITVAPPHLRQPKVDGSSPAKTETMLHAAAKKMPSAVAVTKLLRRRLKHGAKQILMRVPAIRRYISEKHAITAERDRAIRDRDRYAYLLKKHAAEIGLKERHQKLLEERKRHLEQIWGSSRVQAFQRVMFVTDIPPCTNYSGGILIKEMMDSVDCLIGNAFVLLNQNLKPAIPEYLEERINMRIEVKPIEQPQSDKTLTFEDTREREQKNLVEIEARILPELLKFSEAAGCTAFWVLLEGQSMIRLAHALMRASPHPLHVQVTDPPGWWLKAHAVDPESTREILQKFDEVLHGARSLAAASWNMADRYRERYGVNTVPIVGSLPASVALAPASAVNSSGRFRIGLAGQLYAMREWETLLSALDLLDWRVGASEIELHVYTRDAVQLSSKYAKRINLHGWQDNQLLVQTLAGCDLLYCPYWFDETHREDAELCFPSKIATYLASGRPVLFHGPAYSSPSRFLADWDAALICNSPNAHDLASMIRGLLSDQPRYAQIAGNGRRAFDKNLTHEQLAKWLCEFLQV